MTPIDFTESPEELIAHHDCVVFLVTVPFCGSCKMLKPQLEKKAKILPRIYEIEASRFPDFIKEYGVTKAPTMVLFKGGKHVKTLTEFSEMLPDNLAKVCS